MAGRWVDCSWCGGRYRPGGWARHRGSKAHQAGMTPTIRRRLYRYVGRPKRRK